MNNFTSTLHKYTYDFPPELIAQDPASPRDSARLLVYDRTAKTIAHDQYKNLHHYIPKNSVVVFNKTKVLPARVEVTKPTGGKARLLYLDHDTRLIKVISDRKLEINSKLLLNKSNWLLVKKHSDQFYYLEPSFNIAKTFDILNKFGITPLPPYIKHSTLRGKKLLNEYNTVFAKTLGSVAAPTASLHFTKNLLNKLKRNGAKIHYVTLHVSLGTFAKLTPEQLANKKLHAEFYEIDSATAKALNTAKQNKLNIIAVGTTVVRTLESASNPKGRLIKLSGETKLFLTEKSKLHFVNQLITNFHVPQSSLLMLVSAFVGRKPLLMLYQLAIKLKYRLFSFGDGMYIK